MPVAVAVVTAAAVVPLKVVLWAAEAAASTTHGQAQEVATQVVEAAAEAVHLIQI